MKTVGVLQLIDNLVDAGYDVIEAEDEGEELKKVYDELPNIILLDVMMPVMDGFQVLERLKEDPAVRGIPDIMVTAKGQETDVMKARELGATEYIIKPWGPDEVETKVMSIRSGIPQSN